MNPVASTNLSPGTSMFPGSFSLPASGYKKPNRAAIVLLAAPDRKGIYEVFYEEVIVFALTAIGYRYYLK